MTPILSGIADHSGRRTSFLKLFTIIGALSCIALFFFKDADSSLLGLSAFIVGTIGFGAGIVFYNSYLPDIATEDKFDKVSAVGYAYGYIGSVILLVLILALIKFKHVFKIESDILPIRIGFLLVGIWWYGFALITFRTLKEKATQKFERSFLSKGIDEVLAVLYSVLKDSNIIKFLSAYFFFIAGVNVTIYLATIFAKEELGFQQDNLIVLVLLLQFLAMIGAFFFAWVSKVIGNKISLLIQVVIWVGVSVASYFVVSESQFYIISLFVGLVFGGIQSLSRSTYSKLIKDDINSLASYFSFYDVLTKLAIVAGTFSFGLVNQITGNMRYSILSTGIFFVIGFLILLTLKVPHKGEKLKV